MALRTEWGKPGTGVTVGGLRAWCRLVGDCRDARRTALDIVRSGPPEPYDVERVEEAIRQVEVLTATTREQMAQAYKPLVERVDAAKLRWAEAQVETQMAINLMDYMIQKRGGLDHNRSGFEAAREVWHGAREVEQEAWKRWQAEAQA